MLKTVLLPLILFSSSCNEWSWSPTWFAGNPDNQSIVSVNSVVFTNDPIFANYACLHRDDIADLAAEIENASLTKGSRTKALKILPDSNLFGR